MATLGPISPASGGSYQVQPTLSDAFHLGVSQAWVYATWPRKSTGLADPQWLGIRVALVTGAAVHDVVGSLTYYFDHVGVAQQIVFQGRTGDIRPLLAVVGPRFGLQQVPASYAGEQLYRRMWDGRVQSEVRIRPAAVIHSHQPHGSYAVEMELNRLGNGRYADQPELPLPNDVGATATNDGQSGSEDASTTPPSDDGPAPLKPVPGHLVPTPRSHVPPEQWPQLRMRKW